MLVLLAAVVGLFALNAHAESAQTSALRQRVMLDHAAEAGIEAVAARLLAVDTRRRPIPDGREIVFDFADGITEDLITVLSRFRDLIVIARNSSFAYKGKSVDVKQAGCELGVRYVLEGSVRRSGDRLRTWMGLDRDAFYDEARVAIVPMGFCFPGQDAKGADLPPRKECARLCKNACVY